MRLRRSHAVRPTLLLVLGLLVGETFPGPVECQIIYPSSSPIHHIR